MIVRPATAADAAALAAIYTPFVLTTPVSLEVEAPGVDDMAGRIAAAGETHPFLLAEQDGEIIGYAHASRFRPRPGYRFTAEASVYVAPAHQRRGVARLLYAPLMDILVAQGFTQAIAAITLPNDASVRLHEAFGFRKSGVYGQVGWKLGQWWDVGLWQRRLAPVRTPPPDLLPLSAIDHPVLRFARVSPSRSDG